MSSYLLRHAGSPQGDDAAADLGRSSEELLERYLDGLLSERERRVFEKSLESDPALRAHLELQQRVDSSLRAQFAPSDLAAVLGGAVSQEVTPPDLGVESDAPSRLAARIVPQERARTSWVRIAAMVAVFMGAYLVYQNLSNPGPKMATVRPHRISPAAAYAHELEKGMQPYVACTTNEAFATYTKERLGMALSVKPTEGLTLVGWNYDEPVFSDQTVTMLATYQGKPIVIFMDQSDQPDGSCSGDGKDKSDKEKTVTAKVDQSSRTISRVLLHEVRPVGTPSVLDRIEAVEK